MEEIKYKSRLFFEDIKSFIELPNSGKYFSSLIMTESSHEKLDAITEGLKSINDGNGFDIDNPLELSVENCYGLFKMLDINFVKRKANYQFLKSGYIIDQFYFIENNNEFVIFNKVPKK